MAKEKKIITALNYGELHMYYPLKFDTKLSFSQLCELFDKSTVVFNQEYQDKIMNSLGCSLANSTDEIKQNLSASNTDAEPFLFNVKDLSTNKTYQARDNNIPEYKIDSENIKIELFSSDSSININIVSTELEALQQRIFRMQKEFELSSQIYGNSFMSNQERFLLLPFKAKLSNGKTVWINAILFIFSNNMGIIKIELPLIDIDISPLKQYNIDLLVNKIDNCWKLRSFNENIKLSEISDYYIKSILINRKLNIIKYNNELKNIILVDFDEIPNQIDNIPQDIQEELFKIISAPVPDLPYTSFARDAKDHLSKYSWGEHGIKYIIKTTGGVLSLIDKNLLNFFSDSYKRDTNTSVLDDSDHLYMCNLLANNININIEFAILIIMLKKTNEHNDLYNKTNRPKNLFRIRNEYNENILFINKLQDSCYGTVTEQTSQIEEMMPYYLKTELNKSNQIALDTILRERDQQKSERFINFISIGSLFLSLIFGLPSIYDALVLLHKTFSIANLDIPFITLESSSVFLWLLLNFLILIKLLFKK